MEFTVTLGWFISNGDAVSDGYSLTGVAIPTGLRDGSKTSQLGPLRGRQNGAGSARARQAFRVRRVVVGWEARGGESSGDGGYRKGRRTLYPPMDFVCADRRCGVRVCLRCASVRSLGREWLSR